ncbi:endonuclease/exonuclease/phosphatase family protein [Bythopirellula polymerisocia]|uniref:Endonuclease/Exonuclease/phosphatase family protein n=1 Tax=Bythopirellula polymerisocia TaxID=2528003 RepID=A0A5C6D0X0_9BACT|nr:endonuclease/exonuclease/phosphatase family protein [Bythopirellula polymerisocia]TWU28529.1 Endonuclease/Exonuclease/phosphatase family protein [Bythopirellula polymerisocia]
MMKRLANLFEISVILSIAVVCAGLFGRWHYLLDLCSHFRVQAAFTLVVSGLLLLLLKRRRWATVGLVAGLGLTATLWPFFAPASDAGNSVYRLLTLNVLTTNPRHDRVIAFIRKSDPDFIVLQETSPEWIESLDEALGTSWPYQKSIVRSDNFGIAMYSKLPWVSCEMKEYSSTLPVPSLSALFEFPDGDKIRLITTHPLPPMNRDLWDARNSQLSGLATDVQGGESDRTIVAGDLNCTPWSYWFGRLLQESGLRNLADEHGLSVSWMPIPIPVCGLPIDHVLVGSEIRVSKRTVGPYVGSDHRPVVVEFE